MKRFATIALCIYTIFFGHVALAKPHKQAAHPTKSTVVAKGHFVGLGVWIWNELVINDDDVESYVELAKARGVHYVIIKAYNGKSWGVRNARHQFEGQFTERVIRAFHRASIRVYGYGTSYLKQQSDVATQAKHAVNILHKTSADGVITDDVFAEGAVRKQAELLFRSIRTHIDRCKHCRGKAFGFSTFPHVWRSNLPWDVPLRYADFYLPQVYWEDKQTHTTPKAALLRFETNWYNYCSRHPGSRSKLVPTAQTFDNGRHLITPADLKVFVDHCLKKGYCGISIFRWDKTALAEWRAVAKASKKNTASKRG